MTERGWCAHCQNTGWLDCYCEGDMCGCENGGEYPCPHCDENETWDKDIEGMSPEEAKAVRTALADLTKDRKGKA